MTNTAIKTHNCFELVALVNILEKIGWVHGFRSCEEIREYAHLYSYPRYINLEPNYLFDMMDRKRVLDYSILREALARHSFDIHQLEGA